METVSNNRKVGNGEKRLRWKQIELKLKMTREELMSQTRD